MKKKRLTWQWPVLLLFIVATVFILRNNRATHPYRSSAGKIFGTFFNATYQSDSDLQEEILAELMKVDASLSPFNERSTISKINRNEDLAVDSLFLETYLCAREVSEKTAGAFDFTIAPLANAWGFGFTNGIFPDSVTIDSLLQLTGYTKVSYADGQLRKDDERIMLSGSAIAKGFACDVVARFFDKRGIQNYLIEIGGEVRVKGNNPQNKRWRIAIDKPTEDSLSIRNEVQTILELTDISMATSGNYRRYYYKDGKKYGHSIDPRTGYPAAQNILSSTVFAKNCMAADAYTTAFMIMGFERAKEFVENAPGLEAYFIYQDEKSGEVKSYSTFVGDYPAFVE